MDDDLPDEADFDIISEDDEQPLFDLGEEEEEDDFGNKRPQENVTAPPAKKPKLEGVLGAPQAVKLTNSADPSFASQEVETLQEVETGALPILADAVHTSPPPDDVIPPPPPKFTYPEGKNPSSRQLYTLIIRQLKDDGFSDVADNLADQCNINTDLSLPRNALNDKLSGHEFHGVAHSTVNIDLSLESSGIRTSDKLDPVAESALRFGKYEARFQTSHKKPVRVTAFARDGKLAATGSADATIKLMDVGKMHYSVLMKHNKRHDSKQDSSITRPVIRSYYDHEDKINDLDFHPHGEHLLSCGDDGVILYWNLHKTWKRSVECIQEQGPVKSIHCHPSGDYFISCGDFDHVRLYNTETLQGYVTKEGATHTALATCCRWAPEGNIYATASKDGTIKIWDGVNMTCFNTIKDAHTGCEVSTIQFSRNSKYLLSNGKDSLVKLWDMSTGKCIMTYVGAHVKGLRVNSCFSWNDEHVLSCSPRTNAVYVFDTKTGVVVTKIRETKSQKDSRSPVKWVSSSPVEGAILIGSTDCRTKFYAVQEQEE